MEVSLDATSAAVLRSYLQPKEKNDADHYSLITFTEENEDDCYLLAMQVWMQLI